MSQEEISYRSIKIKYIKLQHALKPEISDLHGTAHFDTLNAQ